jgi:PREDICTED: hypothetical protein
MFNARVFFTASVMTLFLYPMAAMAADVSPPTSGADAEGNLPNVTVTLCSGQSDGYSWTSKKSGNTYVCQKGVPVLKGSDVKPKPCTALDGSCGGFQTDKKGDGVSGNGKGSGGDGNGKGSGGGTGGGSGSGGGSAGSGSGSGSGGAGAGSGSGGSGSAGAGSGNEVQGSGTASPDRGSGGGSGGGSGAGDGGAGGGSGATSGNDTGGSSGSGAGSGSGLSNEAYLAALREWGKRWADYFKSLTEREKTVQTNLTRRLADCVMLYGASPNGKVCSDAAIKSAEEERQKIEKLRSDGIARAAKEKAAIDKMKPNSVPSVPMPDGSGSGNGGNGGNVTNNTTNNITDNTTNNTTNVNNTTNITNNGGGSGGGKSGGNGNGGSGQTGNNMGNGSGNEDGKGKGDGLSEYCAKNPDALACQKMGKMSDVKFPDSDAENHLDKGLKDFKSSLKEKGKVASEGFAYKYRNFLSRGDTAACPPPITFEAFGVKGAFKYDWLCQSMEMARGLVIAAFALFTAFFVVKNLK